MPEKIKNRKIVVVNQAVNYLTIGLCNAFYERFAHVVLVTGSIHVQGEELNPEIEITYINKWVEKPARKKFFSYLKACWNITWLLHTKYRNHEVFFLSVPPMGYLINLITFQRFSILIWDVYPDAFKILGMKPNHLLYRTWAKLNEYSFRKSYRLYTIGERMADLLSQYVPIERMLITPIWSIFQANEKIPKTENIFITEHQLKGKFVVQYSGNIGLTHKVELVVELAERLVEEDGIFFQIIGRGPRKDKLKRLVAEKQLQNCQFLSFQSDEMFPYSLSAADLGVVILDETTSKGSVPSKAYNLMSYGIPSLYIAAEDSELWHYSQKYAHGICVLEDNLDQAVAFIMKIHRDQSAYIQYCKNAEAASHHYRRANADAIVNLYLKDV
jgi:hypothetical protein